MTRDGAGPARGSGVDGDPDAQHGGRLGSGQEWKGQRVTVMGLGLFGGGLGAAEFALREGANVTVTDLRDADTLRVSLSALGELPGQDRLRVVLGRHDDEDFIAADRVIPNPAVPAGAKHLVAARAAGVRVTSAIELLLQRLRCRVIAVTGTQGKSSTVQFAKGLLAASLPASHKVVVGGNIGGSLLVRAGEFSAHDVVVLELSSYQLEHLSGSLDGNTPASVDVAALTNIGIDHLARHKSVAGYREAKLRIASLVRPGGLVVLPVDEAKSLDTASLKDNVRVKLHGKGGDITVDGNGWIIIDGVKIADSGTLAAPGAFQRKNLAVAVAAARELGARADAMAASLDTLTGLPHRLEFLGPKRSLGGSTFELIDNGISTTTDSTISALESLGEPRTLGGERRVVVVGGEAKRGARFDELARVAQRLGWAVLPFGKAAPEVAKAAEAGGAEIAGQNRDGWAMDATEAARRAVALQSGPPEGSPTGGLVLFSPACASFDRYPNFRARAIAFREAVLSMCQPATGTSQDSERSQTQD